MGLRDWWTLRGLPRHCFVSHAYDDAAMGILDQMRERLPRRVDPFVFPPINVSPSQRVSDDLVTAIRAQKGLIYVQGPNSSKSVWVNFERDYALRAGMPVFSYDYVTGRFRRDHSKPAQLRVFPEYARADRERIEEIKAFLRERHFDIWDFADDIAPGEHYASSVRSNLTSILNEGGYLVVFLSKSYLESPRDKHELQMAIELAPHRILPVLIDPIRYSELPPALRNRSVVRIHRFRPTSLVPHWNRVDDLMVRIYDMVHSAKGQVG